MKENKSTLTIVLEGDILKSLDIVKNLTEEVTSSGAIRKAIEMLPVYRKQILDQNYEIENLRHRLELWDNAITSINKGLKILKTQK